MHLGRVLNGQLKHGTSYFVIDSNASDPAFAILPYLDGIINKLLVRVLTFLTNF